MGMWGIWAVSALLGILIIGTMGTAQIFAQPDPGDIIVTDGFSNGIYNQDPAGGAPSVLFQGSPYVFPIKMILSLKRNFLHFYKNN